MAKAWTNIATSEIDTESPVTEGLIGKFFDNQEALITTHVDTRFGEVTGNNASWTTEETVRVYVPPQCGTTAGDVTLKFVLEVKVDSGTTASARAQLNGGTYSNVVTGITGTAYAEITLTIPAADVASAADSVVDLDLEMQRTAGAGSYYARCQDAASRFERAA